MENNITTKSDRQKWIDVARAIAMIFVYLGHWNTNHIEAFAYGFHLQLFFFVSGFFAYKMANKKPKEWIKHEFFAIMLPYVLWVIISFVYNNIDNTDIKIADLLNIFKNPSSIQPNYWFFPAFIGVLVFYYIAIKIVKKPIIIFVFALIMHLLLGETPIIRLEWWSNVNSWILPLKIFNDWIGFSAIPQYLFWYAFGSVSYKLINNFVSQKDKEKSYIFYSIGSITGILSIILFFYNIRNFGGIIGSIIFKNNFTLETYNIIAACIIIVFVFFVSKLFEESKILNNIGKSSLNFMGLEYITHSFYVLSFLPMINLGIPSINSSIHIIIITSIHIIINLVLSNGINKFFPVLNGNYKQMLKRKDG